MKKQRKIRIAMPRSINYQKKRVKFIKSRIIKDTSLWQDYKHLILKWKIDPLAMIISCIFSEDLTTLIRIYLLSMTISYLFITIVDLIIKKNK